jgi:hypothetical protein
MRNAIGDNIDWIQIKGMSAWHIKGAIVSLKAKKLGS